MRRAPLSWLRPFIVTATTLDTHGGNGEIDKPPPVVARLVVPPRASVD